MYNNLPRIGLQSTYGEKTEWISPIYKVLDAELSTERKQEVCRENQKEQAD